MRNGKGDTGRMLNLFIKSVLIFLLIFTPVAFGSVELWAFSLMELGILLILLLWSIGSILDSLNAEQKNQLSAIPRPTPSFALIFLSIFLLLLLFQMVPLPAAIAKTLSPVHYRLLSELGVELSGSGVLLSFVPFLTRIEFLKWLVLSGFFLFLLNWKMSGHAVLGQLIPVVMLVGIFESLYGIFEFFSGHHHILHLNMEGQLSSVTGTFINRNYFAGYLLMVIPVGMGYFLSRASLQGNRFHGWRDRLSSLDGKSLLIGFGIILMILGLLLSASRMGIGSLLLSFSVMILLCRGPERQKRVATPAFLFGLAILWAAWIGLDAVISRFFSISESFGNRWEIWLNTFEIVKDFPLLGTGLGTFSRVFPMYRSFHIRGVFTHAENDFLQLASEVGLIGLGLLLVLSIFLFYRAVVRIRSLPPMDSRRWIGVGGLVGILALLLHSLVERNIQVPANAFLFTFLFASILRLPTGPHDENGHRGSEEKRTARP